MMDTYGTWNALIAVAILSMLKTTGAVSKFDYCSVSEIESAKEQCKDAYGDFGQGNDEEFCANVECFLQCLSDAIGDCASRDLFYNEDVTVTKVVYRAKCANPSLIRAAEKVCKVETPCVEDSFVNDQIAAMHNITNSSHSDPGLTKQLQCKLYEAKALCVIVPQLSQCTAEMAQLLGGVSMVELSLTQCGIRQDHYLFDLYKDTIQCKKPKIRSHCFTPALMVRMSKCSPVSLFHIMESPLKGSASICDNVECISKCYEEAIGDCYKMNKFVLMDPETIKVSTRATCYHYEEIKLSLKHCRMVDIKCLQDLEVDLSKAYVNLILNQKYAAYKTTACRSSGIFRSCIKYQNNDDCTEQDASLLRAVYQSWHSYTQCDPREDQIYNTYKGETTCGNNSSQQLLAYSNVVFVCLGVFLTLSSFF